MYILQYLHKKKKELNRITGIQTLYLKFANIRCETDLSFSSADIGTFHFSLK